MYTKLKLFSDEKKYQTCITRATIDIKRDDDDTKYTEISLVR